MLRITIPGSEQWDENKEEFAYTKEQTLQLEHSLVSVAKWESKWQIPFLNDDKKTAEQYLDYIRCMTLTQNVKPEVYGNLTRENIKQIDDYIGDPMTATWFSERKKKSRNRIVVTAERIYYWMILFNIPVEFQKWHLNRLLTLIQVCEEESKEQKKMSRKDLIARNKALNAARRKRLNSKG